MTHREHRTGHLIVSHGTAEDVKERFLALGLVYSDEIDAIMDTETPKATAERWLTGLLRRVQEQEGRWLVLDTLAGAYVGFALAEIHRPGWGYILEFYIVSERRRCGRGRQLFSCISEVMSGAGAGNVWLTSNSAALPFWGSLGFAATGAVAADNGLPVLTRAIP